jgi:hypothetical protein
LKGDFTVTTITPQPQVTNKLVVIGVLSCLDNGLMLLKNIFQQEELIPSHDPIYSSKYSRTADVQVLFYPK